MKIGIDIRALGRKRTGDETYTRELLRGLLSIDCENEYLLLTDTNDQAILQTITEILALPQHPNAAIYSVFPGSKALWTLYAVPRFLKSHPVDVLHVQYITPLWLPRTVKLVTTIHDLSFLSFREYIRPVDFWLLKTFIPLSIRRADVVIGISDFTSQEIRKHYNIPANKLQTISNGGADEAMYQQVSQEQVTVVRQKYHLDHPYLLYVGTMQPRKQIPFLIQTFTKLKKDNQDDPSVAGLELVLVGNRKAYNYDQAIDTMLSDLAQKEPKITAAIRFPGFIDQADLPAVYQGATVVVSASLYEGFNLPLIEAMAAQIPVVCADNPLNREVAEQAALYFEAGNTEQCKLHILQIIHDQATRQAFIRKGIIRAQQFTWKRTAQKTLEKYHQIARITH